MFLHRLFYCLLWAAAVRVGQAHPVAQGSLHITVQPPAVELQLRVANEQIFVAEAYGASTAVQQSLAESCARHGEYLLKHFTVQADGAPLTGTVIAIQPAQDPTAEGRSEFLLRYPLPPAQGHPAAIAVSQNVLNELEFAPGNRWEATYVTRWASAGQPAQDGLLLTSGAPLPQPNPAGPNSGEINTFSVFRAYLHHGFLHILTGYDHLLFMAALVLAVRSLWELVKVVTTFTLAHTLTLVLSVLNVVRLPSHVVEPMIAGSIVFVALQNVLRPSQTHGWVRLAVVFGFGLFHGLGFAGGLLEAMVELPRLALATALVAFSVGVELGHQVVVLPLYGGVLLTRRQPHGLAEPASAPGRWALRGGSCGIAIAGIFYLIAALR